MILDKTWQVSKTRFTFVGILSHPCENQVHSFEESRVDFQEMSDFPT
jgi:hypothetical protein